MRTPIDAALDAALEAMKRHLLLLTLAVLAAAPAWAGGGDGNRAREGARAARDMARALERQVLVLRCEQARAAGELPPGTVLSRSSLMFLDGPEVSLEALEWAEAAGARAVRRPTSTDTVVRVGPGVTLMLSNLSGDIEVMPWNRNEVRIEARHDRSDRIVTELQDGVLKLGVSSREPSPSVVEWRLTVPVWLPLELSGIESEISVTGMRSSVRAQTMRGDVLITSCQGPLQVNSVEGEVHVSDVSGNVNAGSVNNVVRIVRVIGPVEAQTINGDIQLEKLASPSVDASTVNGRVYFASPFQQRGRYAFASHSGQVYIGVPVDQHVNVTMSSFNGQVESSLPMPAPRPRVKGRAVRFMLGDLAELRGVPGTPQAPRAPRAPRFSRGPSASEAPGVPELELESFGGLIQLASQEEVLRAIDRQRAVLDSARATLLRARRDETRAHRWVRTAPAPARAPEAPTGPTPH